MKDQLHKPKYLISYRKGRRVNDETGYEWTIVDRSGRVFAKGWSAGRKVDAVAEAERRLNEIVAALAVPLVRESEGAL
jgi:hypothetical protein